MHRGNLAKRIFIESLSHPLSPAVPLIWARESVFRGAEGRGDGRGGGRGWGRTAQEAEKGVKDVRKDNDAAGWLLVRAGDGRGDNEALQGTSPQRCPFHSPSRPFPAANSPAAHKPSSAFAFLLQSGVTVSSAFLASKMRFPISPYRIVTEET